MDAGALRERLGRARAACGDDLSALARRTGIRESHLRAIEDGRFGDLPPGIYARAAVRAFAVACHLDPAALLAECDTFLPRVDDPIDALARRAGLPQRPSALPPSAAPAIDEAAPEWRVFAAAAIDAAFVGTLLVLLVVSVALVGRVPIAALSGTPAPLALVGVLIGSGYFMWFGGLCGTTLGRLALYGPHARDRETLVMRTIARRALAAATEEARAIVRLGLRVGRWRSYAWRTVP
jgi:hypothetical protein